MPCPMNGANLYPQRSQTNPMQPRGFIVYVFCVMREAQTASETLNLLTEGHEDGKSEI